jgi:hypothetical protein
MTPHVTANARRHEVNPITSAVQRSDGRVFVPANRRRNAGRRRAGRAGESLSASAQQRRDPLAGNERARARLKASSQRKQAMGHQRAIEQLPDLPLARRAATLRAAHAAKPTMIPRLDKALVERRAPGRGNPPFGAGKTSKG